MAILFLQIISKKGTPPNYDWKHDGCRNALEQRFGNGQEGFDIVKS